MREVYCRWKQLESPAEDNLKGKRAFRKMRKLTKPSQENLRGEAPVGESVHHLRSTPSTPIAAQSNHIVL